MVEGIHAGDAERMRFSQEIPTKLEGKILCTIQGKLLWITGFLDYEDIEFLRDSWLGLNRSKLGLFIQKADDALFTKDSQIPRSGFLVPQRIDSWR